MNQRATLCVLRAPWLVLGLLAGLLSFGAAAQTTPTWQAAQAIATGLAPVNGTAVDAAGNTYMVGTFQGSLTLGGTTLTSAGNYDGFLARFSPSGTLDWVRQLGTSGTENLNAVEVDAAGRVYVAGLFVSTLNLGNGIMLSGASGIGGKVLVACYSPQGVVQWAQQGNTQGTRTATGAGLDLDAQGNVYVTGLYQSSVVFGSTTVTIPAGGATFPSAIYLAKYDNNGGLQWARRACDYLIIGGFAQYFEPTLSVSPAGEAFVMGKFVEQPRFTGAAGTVQLTPAGGEDVMAAKYDAQGSFQWVAQLGATQDDYVFDAASDAAGSLYMTGYGVGNIRVTSSATTAVVNVNGSSYSNGYLLKLTAAGTVEWAYTLDSGNRDTTVGSSVCLDAAGNVYLLADFVSAFRGGPAQLTGRGSSDVALVGYNAQGQLRWTQQISGISDERAYFGRLDAAGNLRVVGRTISPSCRFGPGPITLAAPTSDGITFLAQLASAGVVTTSTAPQRAAPLSLVPNPARTLVRLSGLAAGCPVQLLDAVGRRVRTGVTAAGGEVSVQGLPPGLYAVRATDARGRPYAGRLLVE